MKKTEDGIMVVQDFPVFEIQWRRYNAEASIAEPVSILSHETNGKIWFSYTACKEVCNNLNRQSHYDSLKEPIQTIKMIAECL